MLHAILLIQGLTLATPQSVSDTVIPDSSAAAPSLARGQLAFASFHPALPGWSASAPASGVTAGRIVADTPRTVAIEYSDRYYTLLTIHRYASYTMIPLFIAQYVTGEKLITHPHEGWARSLHGPLAASVGVLFGVNTVTGLWNLYDSRKDPHGRTRRTLHSILMLAADAGFALTGAVTPDHEETAGSSRANLHRTLAITSGSVALASYLMMLIWKD